MGIALKQFWALSRELGVQIGLFPFMELVLKEAGTIEDDEMLVNDPNVGLALLKNLDDNKKILVAFIDPTCSASLSALDPEAGNAMVGYMNAIFFKNIKISRDIMFKSI